ncbi:MAG: type and secretion system protein [Firmicutes bacterium]|nr:type and secretion system protein [Bacillota bacterium]
MRQRKCFAQLMIFALVLLLVLPVSAAGNIVIQVNNSTVLSWDSVERIAVANPDIADVVIISPTEVLIVGKAAGTTTLQVWSAAGRSSYDVEVSVNNATIANDIKTILGYPNIRVSKVNNTVLLEGMVNDQYQRARAEKVAGAYGEKVVNLLELSKPKQVKIEAKIVEISKDKTDKLGILWGNSVSTPGAFPFGQSSTNTISDQGNVFGWFGTYSDINAELDALIQNGNAKILSQPNMITLSGEKANILVGGEIPIPVSVSNGQIGIEWKEYGIKLDIAPEVNSDNLITSKVKAEVSALDWNSSHQVSLGSNMYIPPIKTRKAETVITMVSGQSMAIGGLISNEESKSVYKIPFLADIPVIGKLFKSTSFTSGKTEVVIIMTPTLVDPTDYVPPATIDMQKTMGEDPWKEKQNGDKK